MKEFATWEIIVAALAVSPMYYIAWWFLFRCGKGDA